MISNIKVLINTQNKRKTTIFKMDSKIKQPSQTDLVKITPNNQVKTYKIQGRAPKMLTTTT
jgi:DNA-binding protein H-NS